MASKKRRESDKLPDDVSELTGDEVMEKVFSKEVVEKLKEVAHDESDPEKGDN